MRKNWMLAVLLGTCLAAPVMASAAADPFSMVPQGDYAYQYINKLIASGLVHGNDAAFYKRHLQQDKGLTRYEMAVVVATAAAQYERANDAERDMISQLALDYGEDLRNFGVRVEYLKGRTQKLDVQAKVRYHYDYMKHKDHDGYTVDPDTRKAVAYTNNGKERNSYMQATIKTTYSANDDLRAVVSANFKRGLQNGDSLSDYATEVYGEYDSPYGTFRAGRYHQTIGSGLLFDSEVSGFGWEKLFHNGVNVRLNLGEVSKDDPRQMAETNAGILSMLSSTRGYQSLEVMVPMGGRTKLTGAYHRLNDFPTDDETLTAREATLTHKLDKNLTFIGSYGRSDYKEQNKSYAATLRYREASHLQPHSFSLWGAFAQLQAYSYFKSAYGFDQNAITSMSSNGFNNGASVGTMYYLNQSTTPTANRGWELGASYVPCQNVMFTAQYFRTKNPLKNSQQDDLFSFEANMYF